MIFTLLMIILNGTFRVLYPIVFVVLVMPVSNRISTNGGVNNFSVLMLIFKIKYELILRH
jgi:hypothetical protein